MTLICQPSHSNAISSGMIVFSFSEVAGSSEWQCLVSTILQACYDVADVVSPVVTNSSPEGNICGNGMMFS